MEKFYLSDFKQNLEDLYLKQKKSSREIATLLNISQPSVMRLLVYHNIPRRSYQENKLPTQKNSRLSESHKQAISKARLLSDYKTPSGPENPRFTSVLVNCAFCKKDIYKQKCHVKAAKNNFCNNQCHNNFRKGQNKGGKVETKCSECQKSLIRPRWQVEKERRFFCNQQCSGQWKQKHLTGDKVYNFKGGYDKWENYGPSWPFARKQALERDKHTCQKCGKTTEIIGKEPDVHHIVPFRLIGLKYHEKANRLSNLQCLCPTCHTIIESQNIVYIEHAANCVKGIHL